MHQRGIGRQTRQHFTNPGGLEEQGIHAHDAPVDGRTQVCDYTFAQPSHQIEAQRGKHAEYERSSQESDEISIQGTGVFGGNDMVDELAQRHGQGQHGDRRHQQRTQCGYHHPPIGPEERQQSAQRIQGLRAGTVGRGIHARMIPQVAAGDAVGSWRPGGSANVYRLLRTRHVRSKSSCQDCLSAYRSLSWRSFRIFK